MDRTSDLDTCSKEKVFLGGPFLSLIRPDTGQMHPDDVAFYKMLIKFFEDLGYQVDNAHQREEWGARLMTPEECSQLDYESIRSCDYFIALPGSPASPGTHVEIGWATALGKPTLLLLERGKYYTFLVTGLPAWVGVVHHEYVDRTQVLENLDKAVERLRLLRERV